MLTSLQLPPFVVMAYLITQQGRAIALLHALVIMRFTHIKHQRPISTCMNRQSACGSEHKVPRCNHIYLQIAIMNALRLIASYD